MSAIPAGPNGLPVQVTPVLPQTPPTATLQAPPPQAPTAIPAVETQANSGTRNDITPRDSGSGSTGRQAPASNGRGRLVDISA